MAIESLDEVGTHAPELKPVLSIKVMVPARADHVRFVVRDMSSGRMGAVSLGKEVAAKLAGSAPQAASPSP